MILENKIKQALAYFGPMNKQQILAKLEMVGVAIEDRDLDLAVQNLVRSKLVRKSDFDDNTYVAREI